MVTASLARLWTAQPLLARAITIATRTPANGRADNPGHYLIVHQNPTDNPKNDLSPAGQVLEVTLDPVGRSSSVSSALEPVTSGRNLTPHRTT